MGVNLGTATGYLDINNSRLIQGFVGAAAEMEVFEKKSVTTANKLSAFGSAATKVGTGLTLGITVPVAAMGFGAVKAASDFQSAFFGVAKTTDGLVDEFGQVTDEGKIMQDQILGLAREMPTAATEIAGVAEAAGQLGIKKDDIIEFSRVMVMLGDTTNLSAEEAATALARLSNITGMAPENFEKLGATVVDLGNNLATTEAEIIDMGLNIAAAGAQVGMSEPQILAFAGALSSVGVEAAAGGTAISRVMVNMQLAAETGTTGMQAFSKQLELSGFTLEQFEADVAANEGAISSYADAMGMSEKELTSMHESAKEGGVALEDFAKIAGVSAEEFKQAFQEDAAGAIMMFVEGLNDTDRTGSSAIKMLNDMGIEEVRLRDTLLRAAGAQDTFNSALEIGETAWEDGTALVDEANIRYQSFESQLEITKNNVKELGISFGEQMLPYIQKALEWVQNLMQKFAGLDEGTKKNIITIGLIAAAIGPLILILGSLSKAIAAIMANPVVLALALIVVAIVAVIAEINRVPMEIQMANDAIEQNVEMINKWHDDLSKLDTALPDISGEFAGQLDYLRTEIDANQQGINEIYAAAFASGEGLRDDEIESLQEYYANIADLQAQERALQAEMLEFQMEIVQERFDMSEKSIEDTIVYNEQMNSLRGEYNTALDSSIAAERASLKTQYDNGVISLDEYNRLHVESTSKLQENQTLQNEITQQGVDASLAAMQQHVQIREEDYQNLDAKFQSSAEITQHYAELTKQLQDKMGDDYSIFSSEQQAINRDMLYDQAQFAFGQEVTYKNMEFATNEHIVKEQAEFFKWIGQTKASGAQLDDANKETAKMILEAYAGLPEDMHESGFNTIAGLANGMGGEMGALVTQADGNMETLISSMKGSLGIESPSTKTKSMGVHLMEGLKQGSNSKVGDLQSFFTNIGNSLINGFKNLFQIKSPSKVFANIGHEIGAGLEQGLIDEQKNIEDASAGMFDAVMRGVNYGEMAYDSFGNLVAGNLSVSGGPGSAGINNANNVVNNNEIIIQSVPTTPMELANELVLAQERMAMEVL